MSSTYQDMNLSPVPDAPANHPIRQNEDAQIPSTPDRSQFSTPKMSHQARALILDTPPLILNTFPSPKHSLPPAPSFDYDSDHTPTSLDNDQYRFDPLEPPAWKPAERDEVEYVDSWNNAYNHPHHYLSGYSYNKDDSSTICSSQTNNSLSKSYGSRDRPGQQVLRPRGFSINSHGSAHKGSHFRHPSFGSCPQQPPRHGQKQHHRHDSLPLALFSSTGISQSSQMFTNPQSQQIHPLLAQQEEHERRMNTRAYNMIQPRKKNGPYEINSHQHASQVKADATIAGLTGALVDLYAVDRCVDEATAKMLATSSPEKKDKEKSRKTSVGTLQDIQIILELHRVDKKIDRFKQELQMPVFFEEEDDDMATLKELRSIDLMIEEVKKGKGNTVKSTIYENAQQKRYQFNLSEDDEDDEEWDQLGGGTGDCIYLSTDSFHTEPDPYHFFDPHETAAMASNSFEQSYVSASRDDLHEVMDLLRRDVEIDGASRRQKELKFVQPLWEVDKSIVKWRRQMEKKRCEKEMMTLYLTDVQVNGAKRKIETKTPSETAHTDKPKVDTVKMIVTKSTDFPKEEVATKAQELNELQRLDPPAPALTGSMRSIFSEREKLNSSLAAVPISPDDAPVNACSKRSIFTQQEKTQGNL